MDLITSPEALSEPTMSAEPALVFYYLPRACSLAAHIALEESGLNYERRIVRLPRQEKRTQENNKNVPDPRNTFAVPIKRFGSKKFV